MSRNSVDIVTADGLACANCGDEVEINCPYHGPQDSCTIQNLVVRCIEWDFERGDECWERLNVECSNCGRTDAEAP